MDVGDSGAVENRRRSDLRQRARDVVQIQEVNARPRDAIVTAVGETTPAGVSPGGDVGVLVEQLIDEMAAGKPRCARDQRWTRHGEDQAPRPPYWLW